MNLPNLDILHNKINILGYELPLGVILYGVLSILIVLLITLIIKRKKSKNKKVVNDTNKTKTPETTTLKEEPVAPVKEQVQPEKTPDSLLKDAKVEELQVTIKELKEMLNESINQLRDKTRLFYLFMPEIKIVEEIEGYTHKGLTTIELRENVERLFEVTGIKDTLLNPLMTVSQPNNRDFALLNYLAEKIETIDNDYKSRVFKIEQYLMIGCYYAKTGLFDKAKEWFKRASEVNQYHFAPVYNKAVLQFKQDKIAEAKEELSKILNDDNSKEPYPLLLKALISCAMANNEEGLTYFTKSLQLNPLNSEVWYEKGIVLISLDRFKEALECFENAINTNPKDERAWQAKAIALSRLGMQEDAYRAYEQALLLKPEDEESWYGKAVALSYIGLHQEALKYFDFAISINKDNYKASFGKGLSLLYLQRYNEAMIAFENTITINSNYAKAWYNKAIVHCIKDEIDETLFSLRKAIELNENYKAKAQVEDDFRKIRENNDFKRLCGIDETKKE